MGAISIARPFVIPIMADANVAAQPEPLGSGRVAMMPEVSVIDEVGPALMY